MLNWPLVKSLLIGFTCSLELVPNTPLFEFKACETFEATPCEPIPENTNITGHVPFLESRTSLDPNEDDGFRIVNGKRISSSDAPYYVRIATCTKAECNTCGGSWISKTTILTAAHCVDMLVEDKSTVHLYTGADGKYSLSKVSQYAVKNLNQVKIHPNWNSTQPLNGNDIALLKINDDDPVHLNYTRIPTVEEFLKINHCDVGIVRGTGKTNTGENPTEVLMEAEPVNYLPPYLLTAFPHPVDQAIHNIAPFTDSIIAFNSSNESAFCQGDSGGPLLMHGKLFGIVSYNYPPCDQGLPNFYTSTAHFRDWILRNSDYTDACAGNTTNVITTTEATTTQPVTTTIPITTTPEPTTQSKLTLINLEDDTWRPYGENSKMCVHLKGKAGNKKKIEISTCRPNQVNFRWAFLETGQIELKDSPGYCVEAPRGSGRPLFLGYCSQAKPYQLWELDQYGMLHLQFDPNRRIWYRPNKKLRVFNYFSNMFWGIETRDGFEDVLPS